MEQLSRGANFGLGFLGDDGYPGETKGKCAIEGCPDTAALVARIFGNRHHKFLSLLIIARSSDTKHFRDMRSFSDHLASVKGETSCYLEPLSPVFPSFDSFLYHPGISQYGFSRLIALQATTAADHAIRIKGLGNVQTSLKPNAPDTLAEIFALPEEEVFEAR